MSEKSTQWIEHLTNIGQSIYYQRHQQILDKMCPTGNFSSAEWNEASVEAIIMAVATMIEENNSSLLMNHGQPKDGA